MPVDPLNALRAYNDAARAAGGQGVTGGDAVDFGQLVQAAVRDAAIATSTAEATAAQVAAGRGDIVDVVTAIAAAETQLETVMAVRDQVIAAYQEILRMPI